MRRAHILEILRGRHDAAAVVVLLRVRLRINQPDADELFRVRKRKAAQQERSHDRELRRHSTNAEREHRYGKKTKRLLLRQHAEADAEILQE